MTWVFLVVAGIWAGAQNTLAGGGSFVTLPVLIVSGMDARAANISSTLALFPMQIMTGWMGRSGADGAQGVSFRMLVILSLIGGVLGALLLLATPSSLFDRMVPWLVLVATGLFGYGSFGAKLGGGETRLSPRAAMAVQLVIAIYGGYFGGGIGFLMLAALTLAGQSVRIAAATKNVLAGVMNASAVAIFAFSNQAHWPQALTVAAGAIGGGFIGHWMLRRVNERILRIGIVILGLALTVGLFWRQFSA